MVFSLSYDLFTGCAAGLHRAGKACKRLTFVAFWRSWREDDFVSRAEDAEDAKDFAARQSWGCGVDSCSWCSIFHHWLLAGEVTRLLDATQMTLLKRFLTSIVLFVFLFIVLYMGICIVGGAIAGGKAGANSPDPKDSFELGRQAGANFVGQNRRAILCSSFGITGNSVAP